jgi:hypothetical protein
MQKFIIEREIPAVGSLERAQLKEAAARSNEVLAKLAPDIQWGRVVRCRQQDALRLSGEGRGVDPQARRALWFSGEQDNADQQDDRPDHRFLTAAVRPPHGAWNSAAIIHVLAPVVEVHGARFWSGFKNRRRQRCGSFQGGTTGGVGQQLLEHAGRQP